MRTQRAGLQGRLAWLATPERERAAWSMAPVGWGGGPKRSGNHVGTAGWGLELGGKAFALTNDRTTWGGADFLAADAMVAEYQPLDRLAWLKDSADERTPGVHPWDETGANTADQLPNIRRARPLEGAVLRGAAVGPGFHREHVLFLNRAHLIAHHREDNPPINSTEISDPGTGDGDWTAGLHSLTRVRPWLESFCQSGRSTSSAEPEEPLFSALLNFTRSAGDNTGWGGAHFAKAEATLSAEGWGFAHPADDGQHDLGMPDIDGASMIMQGGLHITRTLFGDTDRGILYSPAEFVNRPWRRGAKGPFVQRVEWREDEAATHATKCGTALGTKKWMSWSPFREYDPGAQKSDPGGAKNDPGGNKQPTDQDDPGGVKSAPPTTFLKVPYEGAPRPSVTTPDEIESPSMYGHPIPNGPDAPGTSDWPEGGHSNDGPSYATFADEVDALWMDRYKFTERQFNQQPLTGHGLWHAQYENATAAEGKLERWRPVKSRLEELSFDDDGWMTGRNAALGPGGIMYAGAETLLHELYTTINPISDAPRDGFSLGVFAAAHSGGLQVTNSEIGLGSLKPDYWGVVKGARLRLDFSRDADPNIADMAIDFIDEEGATQTDRQLWLGGALRLPEISAPGTPASGYGVLYAKSDGLYWKDDAGDEHDLTAGGGSGDVTGPAGATTGNFASFADATGKVVKDSGFSDADFAAAVHSHADYLEVSQNLADLGDLDDSIANQLGGATELTPALDSYIGIFKPPLTGGHSDPQHLLALAGLVFEARLSPSSTLAVPIFDNASVSTLYLQPYKGNRVALYDTTNSRWRIHHMSAAVSKALSGLTSSRPYDVFLHNNAGTLTLEFVAWTSATARATALTTQDGVPVKSGDASRRYVGTFYATGATTTAWVTDGGTSASAKLLIWNYYNRVPVYPHVREDTNSWVYTSATWRSLNNATDNRIEVVIGVQEDWHRVVTRASALTSSTAQAIGVGIGLDTTSADSSDLRNEATMNTSGRMMLTAEKLIQGAIGYHYYQALEYARAGTPTLEGDLGTVTVMSGIMGEFRA
jgi:hypothetical protein